MKIKSTLKKHGETFDYVYDDVSSPEANLEGKILYAVHAFGFYNGQMVLVKHPTMGWMPPGGHIEPGETYEQTVVREVHEETNMKVLHQKLIGFVDITEPGRITRHVRSFCIVEPYGEFIADPDGDIQEIKLIDPADYKSNFDWGEAGDRIMGKVTGLREKYDETNL